jgi:hypothetical protein
VRTAVAAALGGLAVIAIGGAIAATVAANDDTPAAIVAENKADAGKSEKVVLRDDSEIRSANARAADAEARARAAEAKIQCERDRQAASNRGAVVGGLAGAVIGSQVAGDGAKSEGGAIGGVAGVLAGRQIAKKDHRC